MTVEGKRNGECHALASWLLALEGKRDEARQRLGAASTASTISFANAYAALDDHEGALRVLEEAAARHDPGLLYLRASPGLVSLHKEPRFQRLCAQALLTASPAN